MKKFSALIFTSICMMYDAVAVPPPDTMVIPQISGKLVYAVWRDAQTIREIRVNERNETQSNVVSINKKATWYIVLLNVDGLVESERNHISKSLSLSPFFPNMPKIHDFPDGAILIEVNGDGDIKFEYGMQITLKNNKFHLSESGEGSFENGEIVIGVRDD